MKTSIRRAALVGIASGLTGLALSALPPVLGIEESIGLRIHYAFRGELTPPDKLIIVAIDDYSIEARGLSAAIDDSGSLKPWRRSLTARAITELAVAGVDVIAIDMLYAEPGDETEDQALEAAIRDAGNVILFEGMNDQDEWIVDDSPGERTEYQEVSRKRVMPMLRDDALATAPFRLPANPRTVNQYRTFIDEWFEAPQMPVVAFAALRPEAHELLLAEAVSLRPSLAPGLGEMRLDRRMAVLRSAVNADKAFARQLERRIRTADLNSAVGSIREDAQMLLKLYRTYDSRYFNLYGRPLTITTVSIHDLLENGADPALPWSGALTFIGYSDDSYSGQDDIFQTFFGQASGHDISGVELAATAAANFIEHRSLLAAPLALHFPALVLLGLAFGAGFASNSARWSLASLAVALLVYIVFIRFQFDHTEYWWPVVVPIMIQAPVALVLGLWLQYARAHEQQAAIALGASRYIPAELVARMSEDPEAAHSTELVDGICLVTDIENYTGFAESISPRELETSLNTYYEALFEIVSRRGGIVTDIVGDSMVSVWRSRGSDARSATAPIAAALEISAQLPRRHRAFPRTRVGLNAGEFVLGPVGAREHLEYRAVGDIVNSAARIEVLNKPLGTTVLAARAVLADSELPHRLIGTFQLSGKQNLLEICEPLATEEKPDSETDELLARFDAARQLFARGLWHDARDAFASLLERFGDDGPSRFYVRYIDQHRRKTSGTELDPVIRISV